MKVVNPSVEIMSEIDYKEIVKSLELIGRTCYKSENLITEDSGEKFLRGLIKAKHDAMLEHFSFSVKFICDRAIANEIVRHRMASFSQESSRYCNYSKDKFDNEITFVCPTSIEPDSESWMTWIYACTMSEQCYMRMIELGMSAQQARSVLINSLKTELVMTANIREWRHFLKLRSLGITGNPHPDMKYVADKLLIQCQEKMPVLFENL